MPLLLADKIVAPTAAALSADTYFFSEIVIPIGAAKKLRVKSFFGGAIGAAGSDGMLTVLGADLYLSVQNAAGVDLPPTLLFTVNSINGNSLSSQSYSTITQRGELEAELQWFGNPIGGVNLALGFECAIRNSNAAARNVGLQLGALYELLT